jgi:hypothetical protein
MGIWCLSEVPGLVRPWSLFLSWRFLGLSRRSNGSGTDRHKLLLGFGRDPQALDSPWEP